MYKLVLSDLDETLLVNHHVPKINQDTIQKARDRGIQFVPCTGRGYDMTIDTLKELGIYDQEQEYMIGFNGALILETKGPRELMFDGLEYDLMKKIFDYGKNLDVCMLIFTTEECYIYHPNQSEIDRKNSQKATYTILENDDIEFLRNKRIAKINYQNTNMDYLMSIKKEIEPLLNQQVTITASSSRYIEFNKKGVNKGTGLKWLANYLDIPIEQTIAIGDNYNDVGMLEVAGLSVAVSSVNQEIKDLCDYVTAKDYFEGAVSETLEKFILNEED